MSVADQGRVFLSMMICGIAIGTAHDLLGVVRRGIVLTGAADLLLGVLSAAGVIGAGLMLGCDPFRLFALMGAALGLAIYEGSVGTIVRYLTKRCVSLSKKVKKQAKTGE